MKVSPRATATMGSSALALAILLTPPGVSQENETPVSTVSEQDADLVQDVIVVSGFRSSLSKALDLKRNSNGVRESVLAEDIGEFPDTNVAETLQRIPGITIQRTDEGEGQRITLRGLGPEFTRVTLNGMAISSSASGREFDFNLFASELFNRVDVVKTPSAETEEGGIGGSVDLRTAQPFDYGEGLTAQISASAYHQELADETNPRLSGLLSWTSKDKSFGVLVSAAYQERFLRTDGAGSVGWEQLSGDTIVPDLEASSISNSADELSSIYAPRLPRTALFADDNERLGLTSSIQWAPTPLLNLKFDALYADSDSTQYNNFQDLQLRSTPGGNRPALVLTDIEVDNGSAVFLEVDQVIPRSENTLIERSTELEQYTLNADWSNDLWSIDGNVGIASANFDREFTTLQLLTDPTTASYDLTADSSYPVLSTGVDLTDPENFNGGSIRLRPLVIEDSIHSGGVNVERFFGDDSIKAGISVQSFEKDTKNYQANVATDSVPVSTYAVPFSSLFSGFAPEAPSGFLRDWVAVDFAAADAALNFSSVDVPQDLGGSSVVKEETIGAFAQGNVNTELFTRPARMDFGLRVVRTDVQTDGYVNGADAISYKSNYTDVLPAFNLAVDVRDDLIARFAVSRSLTRPTLSALNPGTSVSITNRTVNTGNPQLDPFRSNNADLSLEWYFGDESLLGASLFYKELDSLITTTTFDQFFDPGEAIPGEDSNQAGLYEFTTATNGEGAEVLGLELTYQQPFDFLPQPFDGFGILLNYTYADSEATFSSGATVVESTLPFLSKNSASLTGYYEQGAFSTRLVYNWRDDYVENPFGRNGLSRIEEARGFLDFSIQYDVLDNVTLVAEGFNILDEQQRTVAGASDRFERTRNNGATFIVGARANF